MRIVLNLTPGKMAPNGKKWLKDSRVLAYVIKQALEATIFANRIYLRTHHAPMLYESGIRYEEEPAGQPYEDFAAVPVVLSRGWGDCFPRGTLLLNDSYQFVPVEALEPGMKIWGYDRWSEVVARSDKGELSVDAIEMSNGSTVLLTADHKVYVRTCPDHPYAWRKGTCCFRETKTSCGHETVVRKSVSELLPGELLLHPFSIPHGSEKMDPDLAWLDGVYLSDGWADYDRNRASISGQDGCPKEAQKRRVQDIADKNGMTTRWSRKSITINDVDFAIRARAMGRYAPEKEALSIGLVADAARQLLEGIMADSGASGGGRASRCLTTTSRMLGIQVRVLHRMNGESMSYRYVPDHGGLGTNPVHRYSTRESERKQLRVKSIERSVETTECFDIQTDDHYVYLPEHDVTVSNCDDLVSWRIAELRNAGEAAKVRLKWQFDPTRGARMYHVLVRRANGQVEDPSKRLGMGNHASVAGRLTP